MEQIGLEGVFKTEAFASGLSKYTSGLNKAVGDTTSAGGAIAGAIGKGVMVGVASLAALGAAAIAAGAAFGAEVINIAESEGKAAHELEILSAKTNLSTTALQEWTYAGQFLGLTADDIANYLFKLSRSAYAAYTGTKASKDAFAELGVNIYDLNGKLKDNNTLFLEAVDALGRIKDPTVQDAVAMQIFGRSAQDLFPLIKAGSVELKNLQQAAHNVGAVLSEENVQAFAQFDDTLDIIHSSVKGLSATFVAQFLPALNAVSGDIVSFLVDLNGVTSSNDLLKVGQNWMTRISAGMTKGLAIYKKDMPALVKKVVALLTQAIPMVADFGSNMITTIWDGIEATLPVLIQAGRNILDSLGQGLMMGWARLQPNLPTASEIIGWIFKSGSDLSAAFLNWVQGVKWDVLSKSIAKMISGLNWTTYGQDFGRMAGNLWEAISTFLFGGTTTKFNMNTHQMETTIIKGVDWLALGIAVVNGIRDGIVGVLGTSGLGLGDVSNWKALDAEWKGYGTQYGKVVADGMAPTFWAEFFSELNAYKNKNAVLTVTPSVKINTMSAAEYNANVEKSMSPIQEAINHFLFHGFDDPNNPGKSIVSEYITGTIGPAIANAFKVIGSAVADAFQKTVFDHLALAWNKMINAFIIDLDRFILDINTVLGAVGANPLALVPLVPAPSTPPATPPVTTPTHNLPGHNFGALSVNNSRARSTTNYITVHNPVPEPASTSIPRVLVRTAWLGGE
jgi:hypothetical protein